MSVEIGRPAARLPVVPDRLHRITLDQYHHLISTGFFRRSDRLVLLDGLLVDKMTKGPRHCSALEASADVLGASLPAGWHVRQEFPITLADGPQGHGSEPEPDLTVVAGPKGTYKAHHPGPDDIALIVEIADSSLSEDRKALARYAWAGIPAVWIVNLTNDTVEVYTDPTGADVDPRYRKADVVSPGGTLTFLLPGEDDDDPPRPIGPIAVDELIP